MALAAVLIIYYTNFSKYSMLQLLDNKDYLVDILVEVK